MKELNKFVTAMRMLAVDAIAAANSGHPGIALGAAPIAYAAYEKMRHNPRNADFSNRDRFVMSAGHGSSLMYSLLHLYGYPLSIEDLKQFRQFGSNTPGHPERGVTKGVDISTGPLGQGICNAVGLALAESHLAAIFNREGYPIVDHYTYALCGEGCLMEGMSYEACSLAGTLKLKKLIILYDKNNITIEGDIETSFTENIPVRFKAQGWNVIEVKDGTNEVQIMKAIDRAKKQDKPSIIIVNTAIGHGSPLEGNAKCHGSPLKGGDLDATKEFYNYDKTPFYVPKEVYKQTEKAVERGEKYEKEWEEMFKKYSNYYPELAGLFKVYNEGNANIEWLRTVKGNTPVATRSASHTLLQTIAEYTPFLMGGSADLGPSNLTVIEGRQYYSDECRSGTNIHYGIREHAMAAIGNGIAAHGGVLPFVSTFFAFSDYLKNAVRMTALMNLPLCYIFTHDSIGVGEDGPTHQPVEQLAGLRTIPGITLFRPADMTETANAWYYFLKEKRPTILVLSRQNLAPLSNSSDLTLKGGYVISDCEKNVPDIIYIAAGSEVELALKAQAAMSERGIATRVVSMPSIELFLRQSPEYIESVLPSGVRARVALEAGSSICWHRFTGLDGRVLSVEDFGFAAKPDRLFEEKGFTLKNVLKLSDEVLKKK